MFLDRQATTDLAITQEQIAQLMGVRRESVTEAATSCRSRDPSATSAATLPWSIEAV